MSEPQNNTPKNFFYGRPLVCAAVGFVAGIVAGRHILGTIAYALAVAILLAGLAFFAARKKKTALLLLFCALGLLRIQLAYPALTEAESLGVLTGRVADTPKTVRAGQELVLSHAAFNGNALDGRVRLTVAAAPTAAYGDEVRMEATLSLPEGARNEGGMDMRFYLLTKHISHTAYAEELAVVSTGHPGLYGRLLELRARTTATLQRLMGEENGAIAAAMLHGDTAHMQEDILRDFRASGMAHLLAVSGLHVSLLAGALLFLLRRVQPAPQFAVMAVCLLFYCAFTAFAASTVRASLMTMCLLLGRVVWRKPDSLCSLALALLMLLFINPFSLFSVGLQLSFSAVLAIVLLTPVFEDWMQKLPAALRAPLSMNVAVQLGTLPASAAYFNAFPLLSIPANLLVVPLAPFVVLPTALALLLFPFAPNFSRVVAGIADVTLHLMRAVANLASRVENLKVLAPSLPAVLLFACAAVFISPYCLAEKKAKRLVAGVAAVLCALLWMLPHALLPRNAISVLDVPNGYAVHIKTPEGDTLLGTEHALNSYTVNAYCAYHNLKNVHTVHTDPTGAALSFAGREIFVRPGVLDVDGKRYTTGKNGQLRMFVERGALRVQAYSRDRKYDILKKR